MKPDLSFDFEGRITQRKGQCAFRVSSHKSTGPFYSGDVCWEAFMPTMEGATAMLKGDIKEPKEMGGVWISLPTSIR